MNLNESDNNGFKKQTLLYVFGVCVNIYVYN